MNARWLVASVLLASRGFAQVSEHVPPDPPRTQVHAMPYREMAEMMGMDDRKRFGKVMLDRLEWHERGDSYEWDAQAWYGGDFNKLWIEAEGGHADETHARNEIAWSRIVSRWWSTRLGARQDSGAGSSRTWAAFGVAGLAPGFIELEATAYFGEGGSTALRLNADYDLLLTQKLVLHPEVELNLYGQDDDESDVALGLRIRYEFRREVAPYVGVSWARALDEGSEDVSFVAGLRLWF